MRKVVEGGREREREREREMPTRKHWVNTNKEDSNINETITVCLYFTCQVPWQSATTTVTVN